MKLRFLNLLPMVAAVFAVQGCSGGQSAAKTAAAPIAPAQANLNQIDKSGMPPEVKARLKAQYAQGK